jgi:hypothetical protein
MIPRAHWRWAAWAAGTLATFGVLEHLALRSRGRTPTLSCVLRYWLGIHPVHPSRTVRAAVAAGGLTGGALALAVHLGHVPGD